MEIGFDNGANREFGVRQETMDAFRVSGLAAPNAQSTKHPVAQPPNHLTVTHAAVSAEDIAAAEIPESALTRSDALGNLIGKAFNLPPPPPPAFEG